MVAGSKYKYDGDNEYSDDDHDNDDVDNDVEGGEKAIAHRRVTRSFCHGNANCEKPIVLAFKLFKIICAPFQWRDNEHDIKYISTP